MQVKRFKAADMRRALELVRSDLGEDAVILSTSKNGKGVEILATGDDCEQLLNQNNKPEPLPEDIKNDVFSKYENAAEQESLALMSDATLELPDDTVALSSDNSSQQSSDKRRGATAAESRAAQSNSASAQSLASTKQAVSNKYLELEQAYERLNQQRANSNLDGEKARTRPRPSISAKPAPAKVVAPPQWQVDEEIEDYFDDCESLEPAHKGSMEDSQIDRLQSELSDMRELLELQLSHASCAGLKGQQLAADRRLKQMGFGNGFRSHFHRHCDLSQESKADSAWRSTIRFLTSQVKTVNCDLVNSGGVFAFIGPTGAGKTTTIAKLATRYVLAHGRESIALVTLDNERLGSQGQLKSLAKILQIPLRTVSRPEELEETLSSLDYCRLVLIDSPGVNAFSLRQDSFVQALFGLASVTKMMVLAANAQPRFQANLLAAAEGLSVRAAVLTKMDETDCLGESLDAVLASGLPLAYSTDGQNIPEDIAVAKAHTLISRSVSTLQVNRSGSRPSAKRSA